MHSQRYDSTQEAEAEIRRLMTLIPEDLRSQVTIESAQAVNSKRVARPIDKHLCCIWIDFTAWEQFTLDQRNLLYWHEIARVQGRNGDSSAWQHRVIAIGSIALLVELCSQNLVGVVMTLAVTGLGGFQLYQQHWGERFLRGAAAADQSAIKLAMQWNYSATQAYDSLYSALKRLSKQNPKSAHWKEYQVRLRVLEMTRVDSSRPSSIMSTLGSGFPEILPYEVSSPCS
jgi:Protein of unknown function (DUF3318)